MNETPEPETVRLMKGSRCSLQDQMGLLQITQPVMQTLKTMPIFQAFCDCFPPLKEVLLDLVGVVSVFNSCLL